jgi:alpha-tubulin suppressor-like RCC1 family protein
MVAIRSWFGSRSAAPVAEPDQPKRTGARKRGGMLSVIAVALLAACGGGDEPVARSGAAAFADAARQAVADSSEGRAKRLANDAASVNAEVLLRWAEFKFPDLFPAGAATVYNSVVYEGRTYYAREYRGAWGSRYLGVTTTGEVHGLGDWTGNMLQRYGVIADWTGQVVADRCSFDAAACAPVSSDGSTRSLWLTQTHTLALRGDGLLMGWGNNSNAQLGNGAAIAGSAAIPIAWGVASASTNSEYSLALDDAGMLRGWGSNSGAWLGGSGSTTHTTPQAVPWPVRSVRQVEAGWQPYDRGRAFTVVLLTDGTVWHLPGGREIGGNVVVNSPGQVPGLNEITALAQGHGGAYAVRNDGTVWRMSFTQSTSNGPNWMRSRAEPVAGLANVRQMVCSENHCLAVLSDGSLRAWGEGRSGQLGHGLMASSNTPVAVSTLTRVTHIAATGASSMARTADGKVWSWGSGSLSARPPVRSGALTLPPGDSAAPIEVVSLANSTEVACSISHCAARKVDGTVWTWGNNLYGQLGTDLRNFGVIIGEAQEPVIARGVQLNVAGGGTAGAVIPSLRLLAVPRPGWASTGQTVSFHASAAGRGGNIGFQWLRNGVEIAGATSASYTTPKLSAADDGARFSVRVGDALGSLTSAEAAISVSPALASLWAAETHTLALRGDGSLLGWGNNTSRQLGSGTLVAGSPAQLVASGVTGASAAATFGLAIDGQGGLWGWGANSDVWLGGSVPNSGAVPVPSPTAITWPARRVRQAEGMRMANSSTLQNGFMLLADGTVWQLPGDKVTAGASATHTAVQVPGLYDITALSQGHGRPHAIRSDGSVWAIGTLISSEPAFFQPFGTAVAGLANVRRINCGTDHCLALLTDGTLRAWGQGTRGQLGHGVAATSSAPVAVNGLSNVTHIAVASSFGASLARTADGKVYSWGAGELSGRLRAGTASSAPADATSPVEITGLAGSSEIACSTSHCVARHIDGTVRGWGANGSRQLGVNGDFFQIPVQVPGIALN